ncbi:MAG: ABC transporter permease [Proteobacteria bacterium]|nr:ABC transporter permease [Pseudomonadota bacterium]
MLKFGLRQAGIFALGLLGALLLAAAISALPAGRAAYPGAFLQHLLHVAQFDFGASVLTGNPAVAEFSARMAATLELVGSGALMALLIGIPLGIAFGLRRSLRAAAPLIQIVAAAPVFCASLALIFVAVNVLHWHDLHYDGTDLFQVLAARDQSQLVHAFHIFSLPAVTVGAVGVAAVQLVLRGAISDAADEPYRRNLKLMGLSAFEIERIYVAPQVVAHLFAHLGDIVLALFSAAAVAEWMFGWPGAAYLFVKSVALHDWNVVALILLAFTAIKLFADFIGALSAHALAHPESAR